MVNNFNYKDIEFLLSKKIIVKLSKKFMFALMNFAIKIIWFILLIHQIENLNTVWIYH